MNERQYKQVFFLGLITYFILLGFSILFYKERTVLLDAAYALFQMLKNNTYSIEFHRFGDTIPQFLPLMLSRLGYSLNAVMMSYSASFILYYIVCYSITGIVLKRYDYALVILLINTLFVTDTFYYTPSQLPQGMCFIVMLMAFLSTKKEKLNSPIILTISFLCLMLLAFFHPLVLFPLTYTIAFLTLRKEIFTNRKLIYFFALSFFGVLVFKSIVLRTEYETHSLGGLKNFIKLFPNYINLYSNRQFFTNLCTKFYWVILLFLTTTVYYFKHKDWYKLILFAGFCIGYFFLTNISYPSANTPKFYLENLYLPFGLYLALPFVFDILPAATLKKTAMPLIALILFSCCIRVYSNHIIYTARLNWERTTMQQYTGRKVVIGTKNIPMDTLMMVWGTPYEFWLLSTSETGTTASILVDPNPEKQKWLIPYTNSLYVNWNLYKYSYFPKNQYFRFTDSTNGYTVLPE